MSGLYTNSNHVSDDQREATQWLKVPTSHTWLKLKIPLEVSHSELWLPGTAVLYEKRLSHFTSLSGTPHLQAEMSSWPFGCPLDLK